MSMTKKDYEAIAQTCSRHSRQRRCTRRNIMKRIRLWILYRLQRHSFRLIADEVEVVRRRSGLLVGERKFVVLTGGFRSFADDENM